VKAGWSELDVTGFVAQDCERVLGTQGTGWRLRLVLRHEVIAGVRDADTLLGTLRRVPPEPEDLVSAMAAAILRGEADVPRRTAVDLSALLRALDWLSATRHPRPTVAEVTAGLHRAEVLAPLLAVADERFVGRERELAMLDTFVQRSDAGSLPLVLHGPGGVGKSTLVSKLVLSKMQPDGNIDDRPPLFFAYVTFDRPDLAPDRPLTLLGEACRQLRFQAPYLAEDLHSLEGAVESAIRLEAAASAEDSPVRRSSSHDAKRDRREEYSLMQGYASLVDLARSGTRTPMLWVLDTFEQAQRRGPAAIHRLGEFLEMSRAILPGLRVVITGRSEVADLPAENVPLLGFDKPGAVAFLEAQLTPSTLPVDLLERVCAELRGNPLSLRLAAALIQRTGVETLQTPLGQDELLRDLEPELVQGMLYHRILDHVDSPEIRALANPGLAVRRLTPEVIQRVLAGPCQLGKVDKRRATELFEALRREVSLVSEEGPHVLVHRADVRREMLPLLQAHDGPRFQRINEAAVRYYSKQPGPRARAEEVYHRLMLDQPTPQLDARWLPETTPWLQGSLDELPERARTYLAHRLDVQLGSSGMAVADTATWMRKAGQEARELLDAGRPSDALSLLERRPGVELEPGLLALMVEAYAALGRQAESLDLARRGLGSSPVDKDPEAYAALGLLAGRVCEDIGDYEQARSFLKHAKRAAELGGRAVLQVGVAVAGVRIDRRQGAATDAEAEARRGTLLGLADRLTSYERISNPALLRELAAEIGGERPELLSEAATLHGVDVMDLPGGVSPGEPLVEEATKSRLRDLLGKTAPPKPDQAGPTPPAEEEPPPSPASPSSPFWGGHDAGSSIGDYLRTSPGDDEAVETVREYFQSEVDEASYDHQDESDGAGA